MAWGPWGQFSAFRHLLVGGSLRKGFPMSDEELVWLGEYIDQLGDPPWVSTVDPWGMQIDHSVGDLNTDEFATDRGWTLIRLLLIGIEGFNEGSIYPPKNDSSRSFYSAMEALFLRRESGQNLPDWISSAIDRMTEERRELVYAWLDRRLNFIGPRENVDRTF
jgi:hypothetical protein